MFWHLLALNLGMTVREAKQRIDAKEFAAWRAYWNITPFGDERVDHSAAYMWAVWATMNTKKGSPGIAPKVFMPQYGASRDAEEPEDWRVMRAKFMSMFPGSKQAT